MKKLNFLRFVGIALAVLFFGGLLPLSPSDAASVTLSYANFPSSSKLPCLQMERWKNEVNKRTDGKVAIKTSPGGTLLGLDNMMDGVIAGQADIGCLFMPYEPNRFVVTNATALPFGFPNATVASLALWDLYKKYKPKEFSSVRVLTMFTSAPANIYSKKPVRTLKDLKGLQLRASGEVAQVLNALGATTVGVPESETFKTLQDDVVQGAASSLDALMDLKYAKLCRHVTIFNGPVYPFAVIMNIRRWNELPEDVQTVFQDLGFEQAYWTGRYTDNHVDESLAWSKNTYDIEIIKLTQKELARWNRLLKPIFQKWITKAKAKGLAAKAILQDIMVAKEYHSRFEKIR